MTLFASEDKGEDNLIQSQGSQGKERPKVVRFPTSISKRIGESDLAEEGYEIPGLIKSSLSSIALSGASLSVHLLAGGVWWLTRPFLWILISHHLGRGETSAGMDEEKYQQLLGES